MKEKMHSVGKQRDGERLITVEVTLYPPLRRHRSRRESVSLSASADIDALLELLSIKQYEVGAIYINREAATFTTRMCEGDDIQLLPLIGGG